MNRAESLNEAFRRGVASVNDNNRRTMANPVAYFKPERKLVIDKVLCNFDFKAVLDKYGKNVDDATFDKLKEDLWNEADISDSKRSPKGAWYKFAKNIITLADYLSDFKNINELYAVFEKADSVEEKIKLVNTVSARVAQWGFAMASNWIKDMGMIGYCKPDQHMRAIIDGIYQTGSNEKDVFIKAIKVEFYFIACFDIFITLLHYIMYSDILQ